MYRFTPPSDARPGGTSEPLVPRREAPTFARRRTSYPTSRRPPRPSRSCAGVLVGLLNILGGTHGRILDFTFWGRREKDHEMSFEFVSGADFRRMLHHFSSRARLEASWGQVWLEKWPKSTKPKIYIYIYTQYEIDEI